jgi:hypothetical protein
MARWLMEEAGLVKVEEKILSFGSVEMPSKLAQITESAFRRK